MLFYFFLFKDTEPTF